MHNKKEKIRITDTGENKQGPIGLKKAPHLTMLYNKSSRRCQMLKFQKEISLLSKPLVLYNKIFRGYPLFFRKTISLNIKIKKNLELQSLKNL
jgi:ATP-dependent RNA circularization protein (DNA/RNA ligase family)